MRLIRNLISMIVLLLGTAISVATAVQAARQEFPAPATSQQLDFTEWMTQRDLSRESDATRRKLAERMEVELRAGTWSGRVKDPQLSPDQRQLVQKNLLEILEQVFLDRMQRYYQKPEADRERYLDRELDKITGLLKKSVPKELAPKGLTSPQVAVAQAVVELKTDEWIRRADPGLQSQMREFRKAVLDRIKQRLNDRAAERG